MCAGMEGEASIFCELRAGRELPSHLESIYRFLGRCCLVLELVACAGDTAGFSCHTGEAREDILIISCVCHFHVITEYTKPFCYSPSRTEDYEWLKLELIVASPQDWSLPYEHKVLFL